MISKVIKVAGIEDLRSEIESAISNDFRPRLAIVFSDVDKDMQSLSEVFSPFEIALFGSSTGGEIVDSEIFEGGIAAMLLDIPAETFKIHLAEVGELGLYKVAEEAAKEAAKMFNNPAILMMLSGLANDGEQAVDAITKELGNDVVLYGGLASDNLTMTNTFIFSNNKVSNNGIVCLILDNDKIEVNGMATSGWEAVGVEMTITKAEGNVVYSIDGEPALDIFIKYYDLPSDLDAATEVVGSIGAKYPLQVQRTNRPSVLRTPLFGSKEDRSLTFAGRIEQGSKVKLSIQPTFDVIDKTIEDLMIISEQTPQADALVMFSCKARHLAFGPLLEDEVAGIQKLWNAPLVGLLTYGEIGNSKTDKSDFHNETCALVVLKEK